MLRRKYYDEGISSYYDEKLIGTIQAAEMTIYKDKQKLEKIINFRAEKEVERFFSKVSLISVLIFTVSIPLKLWDLAGIMVMAPCGFYLINLSNFIEKFTKRKQKKQDLIDCLEIAKYALEESNDYQNKLEKINRNKKLSNKILSEVEEILVNKIDRHKKTIDELKREFNSFNIALVDIYNDHRSIFSYSLDEYEEHHKNIDYYHYLKKVEEYLKSLEASNESQEQTEYQEKPKQFVKKI